MVQKQPPRGLLRIEGVITVDTYRNVSSELKRLEKEGVHDVEVLLRSPGGFYTPALNIVSCFLNSKCLISITAQRYVASSALYILAAGRWRHADNFQTQFQFHLTTETLVVGRRRYEITAQTTDKQIAKMKTPKAEELRSLTSKITNEIVEFMHITTKIPKDDLYNLLIQNKKIDAMEATKIGLIHAISAYTPVHAQ